MTVFSCVSSCGAMIWKPNAEICQRWSSCDRVLAISGPCFPASSDHRAAARHAAETVINSYCSAKPGLRR